MLFVCCKNCSVHTVCIVIDLRMRSLGVKPFPSEAVKTDRFVSLLHGTCCLCLCERVRSDTAVPAPPGHELPKIVLITGQNKKGNKTN